ncbi:MAG TPA: hypothetical protein VMY59_01135 [Candidatus Thermoplasmatota archaeon]|nr:hypothetical protein [Candidatus Thermoplasmatota archaeon]
MAQKTSQVNLRVSVDDVSLIKSMNGSFAEIWRIGFEKWASDYPDFLSKKAQEYKDMYIQCIAKVGKSYTKYIQNNSFLDDLYKIYVSAGRNINKPTHEDRSWVKARLGKADNGSRIPITRFFEYCQKKYQDDKQRKLTVEDDES